MTDARYLYAGMKWKYTVLPESGLKPPQAQGTARWIQLNNLEEPPGTYKTSYTVNYGVDAWEWSAQAVLSWFNSASVNDVMFALETTAQNGDRIKITFYKAALSSLGVTQCGVKVENLTTETVLFNPNTNISSFLTWCINDSTSKKISISFGKLGPAYGPNYNTDQNAVIFYSRDAVGHFTPLGEGNAISVLAGYLADKQSVNQIDIARFNAFAGQVPDGSNQFPDPSGELAGEGDHTYIDVEIDFPDVPTVDALASNMIALYQLDTAGLTALGDFLWSDNFVNNIKKNFASPFENIISLRIMPVDLSGSAEVVQIGNISTGVSGSRIAAQYIDLDCGTVHINKMWGNQLDFAPATTCKLYLPYIGYVDLDLDDLSGGYMHLIYRLDALTGQLMAMIKVTQEDRYMHNSMEYFFEGNCSAPLPLSGSDYLGMYGSLISGGMTTAIGAAMKNPLMMAGGISSIMTAKPEYQKSGNIGGVAGYMATQTPFLLMMCQIPNMPGNLAAVKGIRSEIYLSLSGLSGFQQISEWRPNTDLVTVCTSEELDEIDRLLKEGVIF